MIYINLTIAEWGLFWPRNIKTVHNFFYRFKPLIHILSYSACFLQGKWDLGFIGVKKDPTMRWTQVFSLCYIKVKENALASAAISFILNNMKVFSPGVQDMSECTPVCLSSA